MSRQIIITNIIPIIVRIMNKQGANLNSETHIRDENLIEFLHNELVQHFSLCGSASECADLEKAIKETRELDDQAFIEYIKFLLNKYVHLQLTLRNAQKIEQKLTVKQVVEMLTNGSVESKPVPDRFSEFRKQNPLGPDRWLRKKEET